MKINFLLLFTCCSIFSTNCLASAEIKNWTKFGTSWDISNSIASTVNGHTTSWNYYILTNYNSLITINSINNYSDIEIIAEIKERIETPSEFLISFNVTSESQSWFYHMYAFRLTGGYWGMDKVSLIYSDRTDKSKPFNTKNNTFTNEISSSGCKVKYNKMNTYRVSFQGENVVLYINNEKILSAPFPEKSHDGHLAISAKNVQTAVDRITVKNKDKIIFDDDFNANSIFIKQLKVERTYSGNSEEEKK